MILKMKYYSGRQVHNIITETISGKTLADVLERFAKEPSADVQEIRRGRWELYDICSVCGAQAEQQTNYCPNCGARMDEVSE